MSEKLVVSVPALNKSIDSSINSVRFGALFPLAARPSWSRSASYIVGCTSPEPSPLSDCDGVILSFCGHGLTFDFEAMSSFTILLQFFAKHRSQYKYI